MGRRHNPGWHQAMLLNEAGPLPVELPFDIRSDVGNALAELLLAHLNVDAAPGVEAIDESEDQS